MTCTAESCDRPVLALGLCSLHYQRVRRNGSLDAEGAMRERAARRLSSGCVLDPTSGCLIWTKSMNGRGYGVLWFDGRLQVAHRVAWQLGGRELPGPGMVLDHICEVKAWVNVNHLRVLSNRDNIMRSPLAPMNTVSSSPTCRNGHLYPDPPMRDANGWRVCTVCAASRADRSGS